MIDISKLSRHYAVRILEQSAVNSFLGKKGFEIISEVDVNGWTKLVAEKILIV